jgi:hypothetical protein
MNNCGHLYTQQQIYTHSVVKYCTIIWVFGFMLAFFPITCVVSQTTKTPSLATFLTRFPFKQYIGGVMVIRVQLDGV